MKKEAHLKSAVTKNKYKNIIKIIHTCVFSLCQSVNLIHYDRILNPINHFDLNIKYPTPAVLLTIC